MLKSSLLILTLVAAVFCSSSYAKNSEKLSLKGLDGKNHSITEYFTQDKWVIVNIWGPKCPPCVDEMPDLQNFHEDHKDKDAIVLGVALDFPSFGPANVNDVREFADNYFISFPLLMGDAHTISHLGGGSLRGTPTTLLFSPGGKLEEIKLGQITQKILEDFIYKHKQ